MAEVAKIPFGLGDVYINGELIEECQAEMAELTIEETSIDIETYEGGVVDQYVDGYLVQLKVAFHQESYESYQRAIQSLVELKDAEGNVVGLTDNAGTRKRDKAVEVKIHPREYGDSEAFDVTLFKAISVETLQRNYGKEGTVFSVTYQALPDNQCGRHKKGNYFRIGAEGTTED